MIGAVMGAVQMGMAGLNMVEANHMSKMQRIASEMQASNLEFQADLLEFSKDDIWARSDADKKTRENLTKQMVGAQTAGYAGQNVSLDSDIVIDMRDQEHRYGAEDVAAIKNNAWREVMGIEIQQNDMRSQANFTRLTGEMQARKTVSTGMFDSIGMGLSGAQKMQKSGIFKSTKSSPKPSPSGNMAMNFTGSSYGSYA